MLAVLFGEHCSLIEANYRNYMATIFATLYISLLVRNICICETGTGERRVFQNRAPYLCRRNHFLGFSTPPDYLHESLYEDCVTLYDMHKQDNSVAF